MKLNKLLLIIAISVPSLSMASADLFVNEMTNTAGFKGLSENVGKNDNCMISEGVMTITGFQYSQSGRYIDLIKFKSGGGNTLIIPTNFSRLSTILQSKTVDIFKEGDVTYVKFSSCGSGGYLSLIDILKPFNTSS
ncbi:hypothetical protein [Citrobacter portucalensis]|uniref:hypothetical protein n=1 Tax=Citrobacter portucalensis TaxID=1639133 RepID=UPI002B24B979|nr:hypothetical protein [Citrobacter portucalensis]MEB1054312.1 hypothetical protein [Citrobacter portucalensis]